MTTSVAQPIAPATARAYPRSIATRWPAALVVISLVAAALAGTPTSDAANPPAPSVAYSTTDFGQRHSHAGRYFAEVVAVDGAAQQGGDRWVVRLTRRDHRRLANAHVAAQVWMPDDGTLSPSRATVHYLGGGRYAIEPVSMPRAGWWNVGLVVDGVAGTDSVAFNVIRAR